MVKITESRFGIMSFLKIIFNVAIVAFALWGVNTCLFIASGLENSMSDAIIEWVIFTVIYIACDFALKINCIMWRFADYVDYAKMFVSIVLAVVISCFVIALSVFQKDLSMAYKIWFFLLMVAFLAFFKVSGVIFYKCSLRRLKLNESIKKTVRTLIIGGGEAGAIVINEFTRHPEFGKKAIAIIDDDKSKRGMTINGVSVVGDRSSIPDVVRNMRIDEIIFAIPSADDSEKQRILNICAKTKAKLKTLPGISKMMDTNEFVRGVRDVNINDLLGRSEVDINTAEDLAYLNDKVILVTGGGGSIGSEISRQIAASGAKQLLILDFYENNAYNIQQELKRTYGNELDMVVIIASIQDVNAIENVFIKYKPDIVFHAAAHKHVPLMEDYPKEAIKNNVFGTYNVASLASKYNAEKFILISTDKAVNPTNIMGATKRVAEMIIQSFNKVSETKFAAVRFGNVLGSNGSVIPLFLDQIKQGGPVTITHPSITRFFMTIREAASLVIQAGTITDGGEIFILDMGEPVKIDDLARNLISLSGYEPDKDIKIQYMGLRPGEKLYEELMLDEEGIAATTYKKIFIANPVELETQSMKIEVSNLRETLDSDEFNAKLELQRLVPTYKAEKKH